MSSIEVLGAYSLTNRKLAYCEIEDYNSSIILSPDKSTYFNCFLYWNDSSVNKNDYGFIKQLIKYGCIYFDIWGPDCEKQHDLVDEILEQIYPNSNEDDVILTSWHSDESLNDALWTFLCANYPANKYWNDCRFSLALSIKGTADNRQIIRNALINPDEFSRIVLKG
jgi:hypothetical protein